MLESILTSLSIFFSISGCNFWVVWIGMELFTFFLFPWLMSKEGKVTKSKVFLYFIIQFLGSTLFLLGVISESKLVYEFIMTMSMMVKLACFPFHSWLVIILSPLSWLKVVVLLTVSKIIPVSAFYAITPWKGFIILAVSGLLAPSGGLFTSCLRTMLGFSSVGHSSWLILTTFSAKWLLYGYLVAYTLMMLVLCSYFYYNKMNSVLSCPNGKEKWVFTLALIAISGLPPLLGFLPKLLVSMILSNDHFAFVESILILMFSLVPLYFYFKMILLYMYWKKSTSFCKPTSKLITLLFVILIIVSISFFFLLSSFSLII